MAPRRIIQQHPPSEAPVTLSPAKERAARIGAIIKEARLKKGLSQHELALQLGITAGAVGQWEIGANSPNMRTLNKLLPILQIDRDHLLFDMSPEERGIAQHDRERTLLELARKRPADATEAAITVMETWKASEPGDIVGAASMLEAYVNMTPEKRSEALQIMSVLLKTSGGNTPQKPVNDPLTEASRHSQSSQAISGIRAQVARRTPAATKSDTVQKGRNKSKPKGPSTSGKRAIASRDVLAE